MILLVPYVFPSSDICSSFSLGFLLSPNDQEAVEVASLFTLLLLLAKCVILGEGIQGFGSQSL